MANNNGEVIMAGLAGIALGVAIGILFAPAAGAQTRQMIKEKADQVKEHADELANKALHQS